MVVVIDVEPIRERFLAVAPFLDERGRRLVAAAEAFAAGYGGIAAAAMATGMAPCTIGRGLEYGAGISPPNDMLRHQPFPNLQLLANPYLSESTRSETALNALRNQPGCGNNIPPIQTRGPCR
jgi:hypothetical protein